MTFTSFSQRRNQTVLTVAALAGLGILAPAAGLRAADIHWDVADGDWDTPASWLGGVVPGNADRALLDRAAGGTAHVTTDTVDVNGVSVGSGNVLSIEAGGNLTTVTDAEENDPNAGIHVGDNATGSASVLGSGVLATTGPGYSAAMTVGRGAAGVGTLTVNGATASVNVNDLHIGGSGGIGVPAVPGNGTLNLVDGTVSTRAWAFVGREGGTGSVHQTGGLFDVGTGGGQMRIGDAGGTGHYTLDGGKLEIDNDLMIGNGAGSSGTFIQNGGTMANTGGWAFVGRTGGSGRYDLNAGTASASGNFNVGFEGGGVGTYNQSGGSFHVNEQLHVGRAGGNGTYNLSAGQVSSGNDFMVGNDAGSVGTFNQTGGTMFNMGGWSFVGRTGGAGEYNLTAGDIIVNGQMNIGFEPGGVGTFNQTGGTAWFKELPHIGRIGGDGTYNLSAGTLNVGEADANSPDDDLVVGADFGTTGRLNVTGGNVNVVRHIFVGRAGNSGGGTGELNHSAGTITNSGWLRLGDDPGAVGTYNLSGTAVLNINGGNDLVMGANFGGSGTMNVQGGTVNGSRDLVFGLEGGNGTYTQSGGDANFTGVGFVGLSGTNGGGIGSGVLNISAGTLDFDIDLVMAEGAPFVPDPQGTTPTQGTVNINGTAAVTVDVDTVVGRRGIGQVNQTGGSLTTNRLQIQLEAGSSGDYNFEGGALTAGSTTNNGTFDASGAGTASLGPVDGTGSTTVAGTATLNAQHVRQAALTMTGGNVVIAPTGTGTAAGVSVIPTYSLTGSARFDIADNKLITGNAVGSATGGTYSGVQGDIQRAHNAGAWNGPGLTTSKSDAVTGLTSIGAGTGAQILGLAPGATDTFAGQTVTDTSTIAMYTYKGDANLDGFISGDDYSAIDFASGTPGASGWVNGDFNYDGFISGDDYSAIDFNLVAQGAPFDTSGSAGAAGLSGVTAVPEPASLGLIALSAVGLLRPRRRRVPR